MPRSAELGQNVDAGHAPDAGKPAGYLINARASRLTVRVFAKGVLSALGHNPRWRSAASAAKHGWTLKKMEAASLPMAIAPASPEEASAGRPFIMRDKDRREMEGPVVEDVLEVTDYLETVYACSKVRDSIASS